MYNLNLTPSEETSLSDFTSYLISNSTSLSDELASYIKVVWELNPSIKEYDISFLSSRKHKPSLKLGDEMIL